jgi:hypothetical protein
MKRKIGFLTSLISSILFIVFASACSAKNQDVFKASDQKQKVYKKQEFISESDCFSVGIWTEREACFSKKSDNQIASCELTNPGACKPYKAMYFATKKSTYCKVRLIKSPLRFIKII